MELDLKDWFKSHAHGFLNNLVPEAGNAQGAHLPIGFGNHDATCRLRTICSMLKFLTQTFEFAFLFVAKQ